MNPPAVVQTPSGTSSHPWGGRRAAALAWVLALALGGWLVGASFDGWFVDDDLLNARWVVEHRDAPWAALTDRHAMHNHVRPLALLDLWAGARLADGDWWGPHLVLVAWLAGVAVATVKLAGGARAGLVAPLALGFLFAGEPFRAALAWNAWLGGAGEAAATLGVVLAARWAAGPLRPGGAPGAPRPGGAPGAPRPGGAVALGAALLATVVAGLHKEPGWLVGPLVAAALALGGLRSGAWRRRALLLLPLVGAAGLAWTWHPANATQYLGGEDPLGDRILRGLSGLGVALGNARPWPPAGGVAAPLLLAALARVAAPARWGWLAVGATALVIALPPALGPVALLLTAVALLRAWPDPPADLLVLLVACVVMVPNPDLHPVHVLSAAAAAAAFVARSLPGLVSSLDRRGQVALVLAAAWQAGLLLQAFVPAPPSPVAVLLTERVRPIAALATTLGADALVIPPDDRDADTRRADAEQASQGAEGVYVREATRYLAPLLGLRLGPVRAERIELHLDGAELLLDPRREGGLFERNALRGRPPLEPGPTPTQLDVAPGFYALGVLARGARGPVGALSALDTCGRTWRTPTPSPERPLVLVPFELVAGCGPLGIVAEQALPEGVPPLLVVLSPPRLSLTDAPEPEPLLDVLGRHPIPTPLPVVEGRAR